MTLVGSGNEVSCRVASSSIPLCIDVETSQSNAFLLDIGNDVDTILGTPGLADLDRDFTAMELHYYRDGSPISFTTVLPRRTPQTVLALPAPPPITLAPREQPAPPQAPSSTPRHIMNRASQFCLTSAFDYGITIDTVFNHLFRTILQL